MDLGKDITYEVSDTFKIASKIACKPLIDSMSSVIYNVWAMFSPSAIRFNLSAISYKEASAH